MNRKNPVPYDTIRDLNKVKKQVKESDKLSEEKKHEIEEDIQKRIEQSAQKTVNTQIAAAQKDRPSIEKNIEEFDENRVSFKKQAPEKPVSVSLITRFRNILVGEKKQETEKEARKGMGMQSK